VIALDRAEGVREVAAELLVVRITPSQKVRHRDTDGSSALPCAPSVAASRLGKDQSLRSELESIAAILSAAAAGLLDDAGRVWMNFANPRGFPARSTLMMGTRLCRQYPIS
jgi:hypothetical protein